MTTWELIDQLEQNRALRNCEVLLEVGGLTLPIASATAYELHDGRLVEVLHAGSPRGVDPA